MSRVKVKYSSVDRVELQCKVHDCNALVFRPPESYGRSVFGGALYLERNGEAMSPGIVGDRATLREFFKACLNALDE